MCDRRSVRAVGDILETRPRDVPDCPGVYAFWWIGEKATLLAANRTVLVKGSKRRRVQITYGDWWPETLAYPCLYIGKTTSLKDRFALHIMSGSPKRLHKAHKKHHKAPPKTSSCQLRWGIEHIFPQETTPLSVIKESVGFSYQTDFPEANAVAERFFLEDLLVGQWRPWFNLDSER
jgi:hypothetical protein